MSKNLNILSKGLNIQVNGKLQNIGNKTVLKVKNSDKIKLLKTENLDDLVVLKDGENLVITYADGSVLVIENFYALEDVSLELPVAQNEMHLISSNYEVSSSEVSVIYAQGDLSKFSSMFEANSLYSKAVSNYSVAADAGLSAGGEAAATSSLIAGVSNTALVVGGVVAAGAVAAIASSGSSGGSDNVAPSNPGKPEKPAEFKAYLVDSPIQGVDYYFDDSTEKAGTTGKDGLFEYNANVKTITFKVGNVTIGAVNTNGKANVALKQGIIPSDKMVTIQDLVGVNRNDLDNEKVVKVAQFLQSLDKDSKADNGIEISKDNLESPTSLDTPQHIQDIPDVDTIVGTKVPDNKVKEHLEAQLKAMKAKDPGYKELGDVIAITPKDTYLVFTKTKDLSGESADLLANVKKVDITDYKEASAVELTLSAEQLKVLKDNGAVFSKGTLDKLIIKATAKGEDKVLDLTKLDTSDVDTLTLEGTVNNIKANIAQYKLVTEVPAKAKTDVIDTFANFKASTDNLSDAKSVTIKMASQKELDEVNPLTNVTTLDISAVKNAELTVAQYKLIGDQAFAAYKDGASNLIAGAIPANSLAKNVIVTDDVVSKANVDTIIGKMKQDLPNGEKLTLTVEHTITVSSKEDYEAIFGKDAKVKVVADSIEYNGEMTIAQAAASDLPANVKIPLSDSGDNFGDESKKADVIKALKKASSVKVTGVTSLDDEGLADALEVYNNSGKAPLSVPDITKVELSAAKYNANAEFVNDVISTAVGKNPTITIANGEISLENAKVLSKLTTSAVTATITGKIADIINNAPEADPLEVSAVNMFSYTITDASIKASDFIALTTKVDTLNVDAVKNITITNADLASVFNSDSIVTPDNELIGLIKANKATITFADDVTLNVTQANNISEITTQVVTAKISDEVANLKNLKLTDGIGQTSNNKYDITVTDSEIDAEKYNELKAKDESFVKNVKTITDVNTNYVPVKEIVKDVKTLNVNIKNGDLTAAQAKEISDLTSGKVTAKIADAAILADVLKLEEKGTGATANEFTYKIPATEIALADYQKLQARVKTLTGLDGATLTATTSEVKDVATALGTTAGALKVKITGDEVVSAVDAQAIASKTTGAVNIAKISGSVAEVAALEAGVVVTTVTVTGSEAKAKDFNTIHTNYGTKTTLSGVTTIQVKDAEDKDAIFNADALKGDSDSEVVKQIKTGKAVTFDDSVTINVTQANALSGATTGVVTATITATDAATIATLTKENNVYKVTVTGDEATAENYNTIKTNFADANLTAVKTVTAAHNGVDAVKTALGNVANGSTLNVKITGSAITVTVAKELLSLTQGKLTADAVTGTVTEAATLSQDEATITTLTVTGTEATATEFNTIKANYATANLTGIDTVNVETQADLAEIFTQNAVKSNDASEVVKHINTNNKAVTFGEDVSLNVAQAKAIADKTTGEVTIAKVTYAEVGTLAVTNLDTDGTGFTLTKLDFTNAGKQEIVLSDAHVGAYGNANKLIIDAGIEDKITLSGWSKEQSSDKAGYNQFTKGGKTVYVTETLQDYSSDNATGVIIA